MQRYQDAVLDAQGNAIPGATVTVTDSGGAAATIYSGNGSGQYAANTLTTDATGEYSFYAANGRYNLAITATGFSGDTHNDVLLHDPAEAAAAVQVFTANISITEVTLTDAATVTIDAALSNNFQLTLGGNRTLANPTNLTSGMVINLVLKQDATGSRTVTWGAKWDFGLAGTPTLSTGASKVDFISAYYNASADKLLATFRKAA